MKKIALALTLVSALLFSLVAEIQLVAALAWSHEPPAGPPFVSPTVSVISPQNDSTYSGNVPLIFNMTPGGFPPGDPYSDRGPWGYGYFYSLDGEDFVWIAEETNTTLYWLSPGNHCILLRLGYMMSRSGFCVDAEPVYFNVVEPFPTTLVIATSVIVAVVCIGLFVYFKRRKH
jgi:hypothetical protein